MKWIPEYNRLDNKMIQTNVSSNAFKRKFMHVIKKIINDLTVRNFAELNLELAALQ